MRITNNGQFNSNFLTSFIVGDTNDIRVSDHGPFGVPQYEPNPYFEGYLLTSPGMNPNHVNLLRDIWGGQNLAAFNNNPRGGSVSMRTEPTPEFLAWLEADSGINLIQRNRSMTYEEFLSPVILGLNVAENG